MSLVKTPSEIAALKRGGQILSDTLSEIREACVAGASTQALDAIARQRFEEKGGKSSFFGYRMGGQGPAFPGVVCGGPRRGTSTLRTRNAELMLIPAVYHATIAAC